MKCAVERRMMLSGIVVASILCCASGTKAEEPYQKWLQYLEGKWQRVDMRGKGLIFDRHLTAKGNALLERHSSSDGVSLMGWQSNTKSLVQTSYGARGGYYRVEYSEIDENTLRGEQVGVIAPWNVAFKASSVVRKTGDDSYEVIFDGLVAGFRKVTLTDKYTRVTDSTEPTGETAEPKPAVPEGVTYERDIRYGAGGDQELLLDLARPSEASAPSPCVVFVHGGGWQAGDRKDYTEDILTLAKLGYVAATVQYRFAPGFRFPAQVEDIKCAVRFLRAHAKTYGIDTEKFGAVGGSAGAHLVMMLGTMGPGDGLEGSGGWPEYSSQVQAVVEFSGPTDLLAEGPEIGKSLLNVLIGGTQQEMREKYRIASPIIYVSSDDAPTLLFHGNLDPIVPPTQALSMSKALTEAGVQNRLEMGEYEHGGGDREKQHKLMWQFLDRHLKTQD